MFFRSSFRAWRDSLPTLEACKLNFVFSIFPALIWSLQIYIGGYKLPRAKSDSTELIVEVPRYCLKVYMSCKNHNNIGNAFIPRKYVFAFMHSSPLGGVFCSEYKAV